MAQEKRIALSWKRLYQNGRGTPHTWHINKTIRGTQLSRNMAHTRKMVRMMGKEGRVEERRREWVEAITSMPKLHITIRMTGRMKRRKKAVVWYNINFWSGSCKK